MTLEDGRIAKADTLMYWIVLLYAPNEALQVDKAFSGIRFEQEATPWGEKVEEETGWKPAEAEEWKVDSRIAGTWVCASVVKGQPIKAAIEFDADGTVTWEEKRSGVEIKKGQWLASSDSLGIESENQTMFVDFELFQGGLEIRYDNK